MKPILLFDVGGVLSKVKFEGLVDLLDGSLTKEEVITKWETSPLTANIEVGPLNALDFATKFVAEWRLSMTPEEFLKFFEDWPQPLSQETKDFLAEARRKYVCACFSNTNSIHQKTLVENLRLADLLDHCFYSPTLGLRKPNAAAYLAVTQALEAKPEEITFFDDSQRNIDGARAVGMTAHRVESVESLPALIRSLGYL